MNASSKPLNRATPAKGKNAERTVRARKLVARLKKLYPEPRTELLYKTPMQLVAAVMLSAQTTDKLVNRVTSEILFKKYKTIADFANADYTAFDRDIARVSFHRNKTRAILGAARKIRDEFGGTVPKTIGELLTLPGIAYKTANVVLGELYDIWDGIPTDTHVRRFALRFDLTNHTDLTKISKDLEAMIPKKDWKFVNNGFVLYGRYICPARPHDCLQHPLTRLWPPAALRWPKAK